MERKLFERDEAVNAWEWGIMRWWKIDYEAFFAWKFSGGYADGADVEDVERGDGEGADHKICFYFFFN